MRKREVAFVERARPLTSLDAVFVRRSVCAHTPQQLDETTIRALMDAAVQAPTAMHAEPWVFVVVRIARC